MDTHDTDLDRELVLNQILNAALDGELAVVTGADEAVAGVLAEAAMDLADQTEVARLDALNAHEMKDILQALSVPLGVTPGKLLDALQMRSDTLPLALVVENGECLGSRALEALATLQRKVPGRVGMILGGDEELPELLEQAGVEIRVHERPQAVAEPAGEDSRREETVARDDDMPPLWQSLPWKHLAAVAGLLLLVFLFWPRDHSARSSRVEPLKLPSAPSGESSADQAMPPPQSPSADQQADNSGQGQIPPQPAPAKSEPVKPEPARPAPARPKPAESASTKPQAPAKTEPTHTGQTGPETATTNSVTRPSSPPASAAGKGSLSPGKPRLTGMDAELAYHEEDWLLALSPKQWVLQLTLAADEDRARAVLDKLGTDKGGYYRTNRSGKPVYVVVSGPYASRDAAEKARTQLPRALRETGPFPRPVAAVQREIGQSP